MSARTSTLDALTPEDAAGMLHERGVGLLVASTDEGLSRVLADILIERRIRLARAPHDFDAVRAEHARLLHADEAAGRSRECARYHPDSARRP